MTQSPTQFSLCYDDDNTQVVESYSCALMPNNLLIHGRLYVTQHFVCFGSWGATRLVLPMGDISFIEKANTMGFVPNALWVIMRAGDRYFFSSFLYRDNCFDVIFQLLPKRLATIELKTLPNRLLVQALKVCMYTYINESHIRSLCRPHISPIYFLIRMEKKAARQMVRHRRIWSLNRKVLSLLRLISHQHQHQPPKRRGHLYLLAAEASHLPQYPHQSAL